MLYSFQCPSGSALNVSAAGVVQCFDGTNYASVSAVVPVSIQPANFDPEESFSDGMSLGWGVAAAMVAAWAIVHLRRGLIR